MRDGDKPVKRRVKRRRVRKMKTYINVRDGNIVFGMFGIFADIWENIKIFGFLKAGFRYKKIKE